ncbi:sporulation protein YjcZ [Paenibacillus pasadenensis]|uniref:Uncharacterized protein n=1 Tax=Paenibacillus pasadenensis TaxID=217090 RepID=A0A2N5ND97_9BACL|nr:MULTISPECIES: sporulation protein YjcZ [Paenibacillus]PLT48240.1 hypothetical protein B8V81_0372 [Paenibacillus pasadenensis]
MSEFVEGVGVASASRGPSSTSIILVLFILLVVISGVFFV